MVRAVDRGVDRITAVLKDGGMPNFEDLFMSLENQWIARIGMPGGRDQIPPPTRVKPGRTGPG